MLFAWAKLARGHSALNRPRNLHIFQKLVPIIDTDAIAITIVAIQPMVVCTENLNPGVMVMKSTEDRV